MWVLPYYIKSHSSCSLSSRASLLGIWRLGTRSTRGFAEGEYDLVHNTNVIRAAYLDMCEKVLHRFGSDPFVSRLRFGIAPSALVTEGLIFKLLDRRCQSLYVMIGESNFFLVKSPG